MILSRLTAKVIEFWIFFWWGKWHLNDILRIYYSSSQGNEEVRKLEIKSILKMCVKMIIELIPIVYRSKIFSKKSWEIQKVETNWKHPEILFAIQKFHFQNLKKTIWEWATQPFLRQIYTKSDWVSKDKGLNFQQCSKRRTGIWRYDKHKSPSPIVVCSPVEKSRFSSSKLGRLTETFLFWSFDFPKFLPKPELYFQEIWWAISSIKIHLLSLKYLFPIEKKKNLSLKTFFFEVLHCPIFPNFCQSKRTYCLNCIIYLFKLPLGVQLYSNRSHSKEVHLEKSFGFWMPDCSNRSVSSLSWAQRHFSCKCFEFQEWISKLITTVTITLEKTQKSKR